MNEQMRGRAAGLSRFGIDCFSPEDWHAETAGISVQGV